MGTAGLFAFVGKLPVMATHRMQGFADSLMAASDVGNSDGEWLRAERAAHAATGSEGACVIGDVVADQSRPGGWTMHLGRGHRHKLATALRACGTVRSVAAKKARPAKQERNRRRSSGIGT
jgi:hypothetical protein